MQKAWNKVAAVFTDVRATWNTIFSDYPTRSALETFVRKRRRNDGLSPENKRVSIIILNRNGRDFLVRCISAIIENTLYRNYEIIVVDNNSADDSIISLKKLNVSPLRVIQNSTNESFSMANNKAADASSGDYLLFLNNDTEPLGGWLEEMLLTIESEQDIGIVGSMLVYPKKESMFGGMRRIERPANSIQHGGIILKNLGENIKPFNFGEFLSPFSEEVNVQRDVWAVTGACMLIKKDAFMTVGGFDVQYFYGLEDVDLCLKVREKGLRVVYCPYSVLYHHEFGTQKDDERKNVMGRRSGNLKIFNDKWRDYLRAIV